MNASNFLNDTMTLDEKLAAIDAAMAAEVERVREANIGTFAIPTDPSDLLMCEGCQ